MVPKSFSSKTRYETRTQTLILDTGMWSWTSSLPVVAKGALKPKALALLILQYLLEDHTDCDKIARILVCASRVVQALSLIHI